MKREKKIKMATSEEQKKSTNKTLVNPSRPQQWNPLYTTFNRVII